MADPLFIVIEGSDGSGKTTIRRHLFAELRRQGFDALSIQGYCWLAPEHTEVIVNARFYREPYPAEAITRAYVGDKEALSSQVLRPHLRHRSVICDRYVISDLVHQATTWGIAPEDSYPRYLAAPIRRPDLMLFIDTPPETAVERLAARPAAVRHPWERYETLKRNYALLVELLVEGRLPEFAPVVRVDNTGTLPQTLDTVTRIVTDRLAAAAPAATRRS